MSDDEYMGEEADYGAYGDDGEDDGGYYDGGDDEEEFFYEGGQEASEDQMFKVKLKEKPKSLSGEAVIDCMRKAASEVGDILSWPPEKALLLLRYFKWDSARAQNHYFEDPVGTCARAGIDIEGEGSADLVFNTEEVECGMCWDDADPDKAARLASCQDWFCVSCWYNNLKFRMSTEGAKCVGAPCLNAKGCNKKCSEAVFLQVFPPGDKLREKYETFLVKDFVESNPSYSYCSGPGCQLHLFVPDGKKEDDPCQPVKCGCGHEMCFLCGGDNHTPCDCATLVKWERKSKDDSETANWVLANTKPCPKCGKNIEKNGGCNHMHCAQCHTDWCWVCGGLWSAHGSSGYSCNKFKETNNANEARAALAKFQHYYERFNNHEKSKNLDDRLLTTVRRRIEAELLATQKDLNEVDYLHEVADTLIACRKQLKYSYAMAYFMKNGSSKKDLFEYNQGQLESATEQLSEFVEDRTGKHSRIDVINKTSVAKKMLENFSGKS